MGIQYLLFLFPMYWIFTLKDNSVILQSVKLKTIIKRYK